MSENRQSFEKNKLNQSDAQSSADLRRFDLEESKGEKIFSIINAYINSGIGVPIILLNLLWFITTPAGFVGLGVVLAGGAAVAAIASISVLIGLIALPITYFAFKESSDEARRIINEINEADFKRQQERQGLFYELLRLRALYTDDAKFILATKDNTQFSSIATREQLFELAALVNIAYGELFNGDDAKLVKKLMAPQETEKTALRQQIFSAIDEKELNANLEKCFSPITEIKVSNLEIVKRVYGGVMGGLSAAGTVLGISWVFSAMLAGFGLAAVAAIPIVGWVIVGLTCASLIAFGIGFSYTRYKNAQREVLRDAINQQNTHLMDAQNECNKIRHELNAKNNLPPLPDLEIEKLKKENEALQQKVIELGHQLEKEKHAKDEHVITNTNAALFHGNAGSHQTPSPKNLKLTQNKDVKEEEDDDEHQTNQPK